MTDVIDRGCDREQELRDDAIAEHRRKAAIDTQPLVCAGCDSLVTGRRCVDWRECLQDYDTRQKAAERAGRRAE